MLKTTGELTKIIMQKHDRLNIQNKFPETMTKRGI